MATINQFEFILSVKNKIKEPILILGSRHYEYDRINLETKLNELGFYDITGVDIVEGEGVNVVADASNLNELFFLEKEAFFETVICMEILTHVAKPWLVGENISRVTKKNSHLIMSECFVRKFSRMPTDYWRFTLDAFKILCSDFIFIDELSKKSLTRSKKPDLVPFNNEIFEIMHEQASDESKLSYLIRKIHRKFFGGKLFRISRLLPEQTFYAIGIKK